MTLFGYVALVFIGWILITGLLHVVFQSVVGFVYVLDMIDSKLEELSNKKAP